MMLRNLSAVVTGASSGIGYACAIELAKSGFNIVAVARRQDRLAELKTAILALDDKIKVHCVVADVSDYDALSKGIESIPEDMGPIDVLINNAGTVIGDYPSTEDFEVEEYDRMINVNVKGCLYMIKLILPKMRERDSGSILSIGSTSAINPYAGGSIYALTKAGIMQMTESLRMELVNTNVRVCCLHPGGVESEIQYHRYTGTLEEKKAQAQKVFQEGGKTFLTSQDVGETVAFIVTRPSRVQISSLVMMSTNQASNYHYFNKNKNVVESLGRTKGADGRK
eukprot:Nk52_evm6s2226 gene=Nk52_evmTU6s2226